MVTLVELFDKRRRHFGRKELQAVLECAFLNWLIKVRVIARARCADTSETAVRWHEAYVPLLREGRPAAT